MSLEGILYSLPAGTGERKLRGGRPGLGHASCPLGLGVRTDDAGLGLAVDAIAGWVAVGAILVGHCG